MYGGTEASSYNKCKGNKGELIKKGAKNMKKERDSSEHPFNGMLVPKKSKCNWCGRNPRKNEIYGTRKKDWDATLNVCPRCWPSEPDD